MKEGYLGECAQYSQYQYHCIGSNRNRIGLLGGTFDPVHNGHLSMAAIACSEFDLGQVIFIPLGSPPHKSERRITPAQQRLDMLRLAIEDTPSFSVSTIEIMRSGLTYTVDTLEALTRQNPDAQYHYIIGTDTLFELVSWKTFPRVAKLTRFICIPRPGVRDTGADEYAAALNETYGHIVDIAAQPGFDISSSEIRALAAQDMLESCFVPPKVCRYIKQNQIYKESIP